MNVKIMTVWDDYKEAERGAQSNASFEDTKGEPGFLEEAHETSPNAVGFLCSEAFELEQEGEWVEIPASVLQARLPEALKIAERFERAKFEATLDQLTQTLSYFVKRSERFERDTGIPITIKVD